MSDAQFVGLCFLLVGCFWVICTCLDDNTKKIVSAICGEKK